MSNSLLNRIDKLNKRERRQITIAFRGSVTAKDWLIDCKFFLTNVPNPVQNQGDGSDRTFRIPQSKNVSIHAGFYDYLFSPQTKGGECKYSKILRNLRMILDKEPPLQSYSLNATGHSLGGALATLFTFFLVCDRDFDLPPTMDLACITFASPKCGNIKFARAFQELEIQKKFICIRVANYRDLITERPDRLTCWTFCLQDAIFRHVGIEILLFPDSQQKKNNESDNHKKYRIKYPRIRRSRIRQLTDDFTVSLLHTFQCTASVTCGCCIHDYMQWHSCDEYLNRVENIEAALQSLPVESIHNAYYNLVSEESETFTLPIKLPSKGTS